MTDDIISIHDFSFLILLYLILTTEKDWIRSLTDSTYTK